MKILSNELFLTIYLDSEIIYLCNKKRLVKSENDVLKLIFAISKSVFQTHYLVHVFVWYYFLYN